jgi:hypothetical protein
MSKYLIKVQDHKTGTVNRYYAENIVSASSFMTQVHIKHHGMDLHPGGDYKIEILTDYGQEENWENAEVQGPIETFPIMVKLNA